MNIPLRYAQVVWDYHGNKPDAPAIMVVGYDDDGRKLPFSPADNRDYFCSWGACNSEFAEAGEAERLMMLLEKFNELTIAEVRRLDPLVVHHAFSVIPEYRVNLIRRGLGSTIPAELRDEEAEEEVIANSPLYHGVRETEPA